MFSRYRTVTAALVGLTLLGACRDPLHPGLAVPTTMGADAYEASVVIDPASVGGVHTVRVRWRSGEQAPAMGGFRATLVLPPGVTLAGEVEGQTDAQGELLRVVHAETDRVLATGIATQGFAMGDLFVVQLRGAPDRLRLLRLDVQEVIDQRGRNRRAATLVREVRP